MHKLAQWLLLRLHLSCRHALKGLRQDTLTAWKRLLAAGDRQLVDALGSEGIEVHGHRMFIDRTDALNLLLVHTYERLETEILRRTVRPGELAIDIGAHIGYFTLILANLVGEEGAVFAFEPDPINSTLLRRNVSANRYRNITVVESAVSNCTGTANLYLSPINSGDHHLYGSSSGRRAVPVGSVRLDDYFARFEERVALIKMDVQGSEDLALQGMTRFLSRQSDTVLLVEFWPVGLKRAGTDPAEYLTHIADLGFELYSLDRALKKPVKAARAQLLNHFTVENEKHTNLLCVRPSCISSLGL